MALLGRIAPLMFELTVEHSVVSSDSSLFMIWWNFSIEMIFWLSCYIMAYWTICESAWMHSCSLSWFAAVTALFTLVLESGEPFSEAAGLATDSDCLVWANFSCIFWQYWIICA